MSLDVAAYGVLLQGLPVGTLLQRGDYTVFRFDESYLESSERPVLGLWFEERLRGRYAAALRLPEWFSNLLPEGVVRSWIADGRDVSADREMELLAEVGHDLPGAVQVFPYEGTLRDIDWESVQRDAAVREAPRADAPWRVSLAGVHLKLSLVSSGDRLTLPAFGGGDDWIAKFPDPDFPQFPQNEFYVMRLAALAGLDVPPIRLVHRELFDRVPDRVWRNKEEFAYAIKRFDRVANEARSIHIEDLAQVRNFYPHEKYNGSFETVAGLVYRGRDLVSLLEFVRRLTFMILVTNGDAHLKNWSLIYPDGRIPVLAPAYDIMSTALYRPSGAQAEDLGLKFGGTKRFEKVRLRHFSRLAQRLGVDVETVEDQVTSTIERTTLAWSQLRDEVKVDIPLHEALSESIHDRGVSLLSTSS